MTQKIFNYMDAETPLQGYLSFDAAQKTPRPGILICPDWTGRNTFADSKADFLAQLGYVGFAIDIYGNGKQGQTNAEKIELMQPFMTDRKLLRKRLLAALHTMQHLECVDKHQIAIMGFCFGGLCALDLARSGAAIKGAVSFHGLLTAPENLPNAKIQAKVLVLHGYADPMVPPEQVLTFTQEMTAAQVDWQMHMYGNTLHAFTNPTANDSELGTVYSEIANQRSLQAMQNFFQEIFN